MVQKEDMKLPKMSKALLGSKLPKIKLPQKPTYIKLAQDLDFFELFASIEAAFQTCFIFESLGEEGRLSRYSIIGFNPQHIIKAKGNTLYFDNKAFKVKNPLDPQDRKDLNPLDPKSQGCNPYFALRQIMPQQTISKNYAGGLIGYISYEAVNYFENAVNLKVHPLFDSFLFGVFTDGLILDKITNELSYFYHDQDRSNILLKLMKSKSKKQNLKAKFLGDSLTKDEHTKIVEKVKEQIKKGNIFQCEVGFKSEFEVTGNSLEIYKRLRQVNPSPFMYYLKFGDKKIIGASPELLFSLRNGEMQTSPLAGTIRRGKNKSEDQRLARELLSDEKEKAEHNMLVDLHRNDMGKVSEFGTVKVRDLMTVKRFKYVSHISSEIVGIIKKEEDSFSSLAANFPTGTLTGTPKIEAMKIIDQNEFGGRGPYGGAVGHFGFNGDCTFAIAIRSLFISGEYAYTQTSGGIVYDSRADKEYAEIIRKLAAMKEVLI